MITFRPALDSRPNKEGKYPLLIRICQDRKYTPWYLGRSIDKNQWNKKAKKVKRHPNSQRLNALITSKVAEADKLFMTLSLSGQHLSRQEILLLLKAGTTADEYIRNQSQGYKNRNKERKLFFAYAQDYLNNLALEGKYNQHVADKPRVKRFREFLALKGKIKIRKEIVLKDIAFQDVTVTLLKNFKAYLKGTYGISERTCINYLVVLRTIYNLGIKNGEVKQEYYPFGKDKVAIRFPDSKKIGLTREELDNMIKLDLKDHPKIAHARNKWLISYYFAGARISDVLRLRWSDIQNGRLHYTMGKNEKPGSLKIIQQALDIFDEYRTQECASDDLIFPDLKGVTDFSDTYLVQRKISYVVKTTNKYLKKLAEMASIDKELTNHIARHTFGYLSGNKIPIGILQILYRHASVTTTINYQQSFMNEEIDDALESVISR